MLHLLHAFLSIAQEKNISRAARLNYVTAQAYTQQLNTLETELGFALFNRGRHGVELTEAGAVFLKTAQDILSRYEAALHECRKIANGVLEVTIPLTENIYSMRVELLSRVVNQTFPEIRLLPQKTDAPVSSWMELVKSGQFTIAEYYASETEPAPPVKFFTVEPQVQNWCLFAPSSQLHGREIIQPEDLRGMTIVSNPVGSQTRLKEYMDARGLDENFIEIPLDKYEIQKACNDGCVALFLEETVKGFFALECAPLNFPSGTACGFLYRDDADPRVLQLLDAFLKEYRKLSR